MRISAMFDRLKGKRPALVAYLTAGDPSPGRTPALVAALERGGADLIELGVPFSDPVADGPVIQAASERALEAGTTLVKVLEIAAEIRRNSQIPLLLFTYLNPVLKYGVSALARDAVNAGIDGVLLTDLTVEEAGETADLLRKAPLDTVFLAAPTSPPRRLEMLAKRSSGFVYLVSRMGVTGERQSLSDSLAPLVSNMRRVTSLPLVAGFGISTPAQAALVGRMADGVAVGSAIVRLIEQNQNSPGLENKLESFARGLSSALHGVNA